ncbi:hypothetical protein [Acinetobacter schindleri]|uniref:hypothetical protein n=1 Tax=Acinetobacter schindleri TaxID=108981 RepID=UPI00160FD5EA|nr:hypothetical protein [Acinetobacter schindleri]MBB4834928.1 hypothetical protein [Acinetobacter schindleri]WBX36753.1 hypothetical protein MYA84_08395 [Acinetobacter schindleri]
MSFGLKKGQKKPDPKGGKIQGPGTGTSDDVKKTVSDGTYIMPADSTQQIGAQNLEQMGQGQPVDVNVSNGEFEMTPEQVHAIGVQALDQMKDLTHTPVDQPQVEGGFGLKKPQLFFANGGVVEDEWKRNLKTQSQPQSGFGAVQPRSGFNQTSTAPALTDNKNIQFPTAQPKVNTPAVAPTQASTQQVQPKEQPQSSGWGIGKTAKTFLAPEHDNGAWNPVGGLVNTATGLGKGLLGGAGALAAGAGEGIRSTAAYLGGANNPNRGNMVAPSAEFSGQGFDQARLGMRQMFGLSGENLGSGNQGKAATSLVNQFTAQGTPAVSSMPKNNAAQQKTNTTPSFNDQMNDVMYGGGQAAQPASRNTSPYAIQQKGNSFSYANPGAAAQARAAGIPELQSSGFTGGIRPTRDPQGVKNLMTNTREMGPSEQQIQAAMGQQMNPQGVGLRYPERPVMSDEEKSNRASLASQINSAIDRKRGPTAKQAEMLLRLSSNDPDALDIYKTDANNATSVQNNTANNNASILQTGMREDGQNLRHGASLAQDGEQFNANFGLKARQQNLTEKKESFGIRQAERAEKLQEMYDKAETDEQRQSIQARIDRLTGAKAQNGRDRYMTVGGGQEWDQNANVMINRPQQIFDTQTQQYLNTSPSSNSIPKPGEIREGYRYKGGDPSQQSSWEAV